MSINIRRDPIYISTEVYRWLRLLAKADFETVRASGEFSNPDRPTIKTADEIADTMLRQAIREQHPTLADLQKQINKLEDETIDTLRKDASKQGEAQPE